MSVFVWFRYISSHIQSFEVHAALVKAAMAPALGTFGFVVGHFVASWGAGMVDWANWLVGGCPVTPGPFMLAQTSFMPEQFKLSGDLEDQSSLGRHGSSQAACEHRWQSNLMPT